MDKIILMDLEEYFHSDSLLPFPNQRVRPVFLAEVPVDFVRGSTGT